jgi:hypothetical protein
VVPAALADAGEGRLAQPHLELVSEHDAEDQVPARLSGPLPARHGGGDDVRRVRRVLLPVDVVVVHDADHQCVEQRGGDRIQPLARADDGGGARAGVLLEHLEGDLHVVLLEAAERAAQGVQ